MRYSNFPIRLHYKYILWLNYAPKRWAFAFADRGTVPGSQTYLDAARLIFIDETWAKTNMARSHGRCLRGQSRRPRHFRLCQKTTPEFRPGALVISDLTDVRHS